MSQSKFYQTVEKIGLEPYLTATADEHNGISWAIFKLLMEKNTSSFRIHILMGLPRPRTDDLIKIYRKQYKKT